MFFRHYYRDAHSISVTEEAVKEAYMDHPLPKQKAEDKPLPRQGSFRQLLRDFVVFRRFDEFNGGLIFFRVILLSQSPIFLGYSFPLTSFQIHDLGYFLLDGFLHDLRRRRGASGEHQAANHQQSNQTFHQKSRFIEHGSDY
jgi:hypothetical protein